MWQYLTKEARLALHNAEAEVIRLRHEIVEPVHILLGLMVGEHSIAISILKQKEISYDDVANLSKIVAPVFVLSPVEVINLSTRSKEVLEIARRFCVENNYQDFDTGAILFGLIDASVEPLRTFFDSHGLTKDVAQSLLRAKGQRQSEFFQEESP